MRLLFPLIVLIPLAVVSAQDRDYATLLSSDPSTEDLPEGRLKAENVFVKAINEVDVPAEAEGVLTELKIREGDDVREGDEIAVIDSKSAELTLKLKRGEEMEARIKASNDVNKRDAINNKALADAEAASFDELRRAGGISKYDAARKRLEAKKQALRIELADLEERTGKVQVVIKGTELSMAEEELNKRKVKSPVEGTVEVRLAQKGQWVQPGAPIAKVIQMDRLRVEGDLDGRRYPGRVKKGLPVTVIVKTGEGSDITREARLNFVSMRVDGNGNHRVWVEVENRFNDGDWLFKPGMEAEILAEVDR